MSNSAFIKSSIAKKYWMALTGLFLCLFLVGHLLGNLQLIFSTGEEGRRVFNEYAFFMTHNPAIKVLSYLTYFSILFHAVDGIALFVQNKKRDLFLMLIQSQVQILRHHRDTWLCWVRLCSFS